MREAEGTPPRQAEYDLSQLYRTAAEKALTEAAPLSPIGTLFRPSSVAYSDVLDGARRIAPVLSEPGADPTEQARRWFVAPVGIFSPEGVSGGANPAREHCSVVSRCCPTTIRRATRAGRSAC